MGNSITILTFRNNIFFFPTNDTYLLVVFLFLFLFATAHFVFVSILDGVVRGVVEEAPLAISPRKGFVANTKMVPSDEFRSRMGQVLHLINVGVDRSECDAGKSDQVS